ncbi:hypothetical protein Cni_G28801 [Canna indica]|uniref:DUF707 domain-containing protein n=1 Tax=Canna indica TaxID=4628 RepID=A0AAQ3L3N1_9LILI|nr:hypothetical protein Cni_G28801 [Canna indica]
MEQDDDDVGEGGNDDEEDEEEGQDKYEQNGFIVDDVEEEEEEEKAVMKKGLSTFNVNSAYPCKLANLVNFFLRRVWLLNLVLLIATEMNPQLCIVLVCASATLLILYRTTNDQYQHTKEHDNVSATVGYLPHGLAESKSDMELKPLWLSKDHIMKESDQNHHNLLAMTVGIKQKLTVDAIVRKFLADNFTVILFHYDGNVNDWHDLCWSNAVIHIAADSQTKWWFAKRFLHPDVISVYDYIFLWDEDLGVDNFNPGRYLKVIKSERLEISQPALDPNLSEIHHRITARRKKSRIHRRVYDRRSGECSSASTGPPCTGWVEGMAPVFSRSAWRCVWHLIQNDLIHGWGMDMKLGYCAQGDRTKKVGVVDSEFVVHQGVQTLGGSSTHKYAFLMDSTLQARHQTGAFDARTEIRRQSRSELYLFQERWNHAAREDKDWVDPFQALDRRNKDH